MLLGRQPEHPFFLFPHLNSNAVRESELAKLVI